MDDQVWVTKDGLVLVILERHKLVNAMMPYCKFIITEFGVDAESYFTSDEELIDLFEYVGDL